MAQTVKIGRVKGSMWYTNLTDINPLEGDMWFDKNTSSIYQYKNNEWVKIDKLPTKVSDLENDSGYINLDTLNDTKDELQEYADTKVANLVNSAPETLDTLKELSNALGNNPNFATVITHQIGNKFDKTGGTIEGNVTASRFYSNLYHVKKGQSGATIGSKKGDIFTYTTNYKEVGNPDYEIAVKKDIPTKVSGLENDSKFATEKIVKEEIAKAQLGGVDFSNFVGQETPEISWSGNTPLTYDTELSYGFYFNTSLTAEEVNNILSQFDYDTDQPSSENNYLENCYDLALFDMGCLLFFRKSDGTYKIEINTGFDGELVVFDNGWQIQSSFVYNELWSLIYYNTDEVGLLVADLISTTPFEVTGGITTLYQLNSDGSLNKDKPIPTAKKQDLEKVETRVKTLEETLANVGSGGSSSGTGSNKAKLVASYTFDLEDTGYGLFEYFTDETDTFALKENTMYLIEMPNNGYGGQLAIGKTGKGPYPTLVTQSFLLPPSNDNTDEYSWIHCYLSYDTLDDGTGNLTICVFGYDFDYNSDTFKSINKFTVNFYELPITIGGNE